VPSTTTASSASDQCAFDDELERRGSIGEGFVAHAEPVEHGEDDGLDRDSPEDVPGRDVEGCARSPL